MCRTLKDWLRDEAKNQDRAAPSAVMVAVKGDMCGVHAKSICRPIAFKWLSAVMSFISRKLALWSLRELSFTNYFLGSSMGETKAHGLKKPQIKGFKGRGGGGGGPIPFFA